MIGRIRMSELITLSIAEIDIPADRSRELDNDWVEALAGMITETGLINPITVAPAGARYRLISGLHRLSAFILLDRDEIPCRISTAETDDAAKLEEIVENIGRNELNALDRAHHLYDLKRVYERLHPEAKHGGDRKSADAKNQNEIFAFSKAAADTTGLGRRSIELSVAIWKGLSVASRQRCARSWIASHQSSLQQLSSLTHPIQAKVLDILLADEPQATTVGDALAILKDGRLLTHVEKKFGAINKKLSGLKDEELDVVLAFHEERILAWLKRTGRI